MQAATNPVWWKRPIVWSGIRQDLDLLVRYCNQQGMDKDAEGWRHLAKLAEAQS